MPARPRVGLLVPRFTVGAGVTHHPVLVPGRIGSTLALVARVLGAREIAA